MKNIECRNVNQALPYGVRILLNGGVSKETRNGPALVFPSPVTTTYTHPCERVLLYPERDANPFFHLYESFWMLAGQNDLASVAFFAENMKLYSDDGITLHGAYGHRWSQHFSKLDQLVQIINELNENPHSRRCVLQMWDSVSDLNKEGAKDVPCNTHAYFWIDNGALNMTVSCRSNDIVWGAYGANAVHFSVLLEFIAAMTLSDVGTMYQMSNNYHMYTGNEAFQKAVLVAERYPSGQAGVDLYRKQYVRAYPMFESAVGYEDTLDQIEMVVRAVQDCVLSFKSPRMVDALCALEDSIYPESSPFINSTFIPMMLAYFGHKMGAGQDSIREHLAAMPENSDWQRAAVEWFERRWSK